MQPDHGSMWCYRWPDKGHETLFAISQTEVKRFRRRSLGLANGLRVLYQSHLPHHP